MRHFLSLLILTAFVSVSADAQNSPEFEAMIRTMFKQFYEVKGKVYGVDDYETTPYALQGANIKVTCVADSTVNGGAAAFDKGGFQVGFTSRTRLKDPRLHVVVSYLGMQSYDKILTPVKSKENGIDKFTLSLDSIVLQGNPVTLAEAEVVAELKRMYQKGDTVIFNADAYEMPSGSVLLDLVRRLPGLTYTDGKMTYLGKDIQEIKLNGDSFFKRDMSIALNNMPNSKLKSLKVYEVPDDTLDVTSDNHLVMDMETKEKMDRAVFAEVSAGTTEKVDHYQFSGGYSMWKKKGPQLNGSISTQDIPSEGTYQLKSVNTFGYIGYEQKFGDTSVNGNGDYTYNHNENKTESFNRLFMPDYTQNSSSQSTSGSKGKNISASAGANGSISKRLRWNTNVNFSHDTNDDYSQSTDSISNEGEGLVSATRQTNTTHSNSKAINGYFNFTYNLKENSDDNIRMSFNLGHNESKSTQFNQSYSRFVQLNDSTRNVNHRISSPSRSNNGSIYVSYNKDIGKHTFIGLNYNFSYSGDKSLQNYEDVHEDGSLSTVDSLHYDKRNKQVTNRIEASYFYNSDTLRTNLRLSVAPTHRSIDNDQYGNAEHLSSNGVQYSLSTWFELSWKKNQYRLNYGCSNVLPGVSSLSSVTDYRDPMNISSGNPNLKSAINHSLSLEFQLKSLMRLTLSYNLTTDQITSLTLLDKETGIRHTSPANINGNWNTNEYVFFTIPIHDLTLSVNANHSFNHNVAYVQSTTDASAQKSVTRWHKLSTQLGASYGNKYWTLRGNAGYSFDHSQSDYLTTATVGHELTASADITYEAPFGLEVGTSCNLRKPFGYEMAAANKAECIWGLTAEYKFLKNDMASIRLNWRDILNSYNGFNASMSSTSWNESRTYGDTSMFVISFSYRMNGF